MVKWFTFILILVVTAWALWYFGVLQSIGGSFDAWLKFIGAR